MLRLPRLARPLPAALLLAALLLAACGGGASSGSPAQAGARDSAPGGERSGRPGGRRPGGAPGSGGPARPPVLVGLAPVQRGTLETTVRVVGSLYGTDDVTISAEVPGRLQATQADIGDRVAPGDLLARIDPTDYDLAVQQAENSLREALARLGLTRLPSGGLDVEAVATVARARAQAHNTHARLERARSLFERQPPLLSQQEFADIETAHEVAQGDYEVAKLEADSQLAVARSRHSELLATRERLNKTRLAAPAIEHAEHTSATTFAVTKRYLAAGEYVRTGDPLFDLVLDDPIKLRGQLPERHLGEVQVGQTARIRVESGREPFTGRVARINPAVDPQNRSFQVEIDLPNAHQQLRPGAFADGVIVTGTREAVALVPRSAVISFAGIDRVFSVRAGQAVEHLVELGPPRGGLLTILKGLEDTAEVITAGNERLSKGDAVQTTGTAAR